MFDRTEVCTIEYKTRGVKLITGSGCTVKAIKIVNASGYEITEFINNKILKLNSTYALASEQLQSNIPIWNNNTVLWNTANPYLYIRATTDGRIIIGGRDEEYYNPLRRDKLIERKTAQLKKDFFKLFPNTELVPEFSWTGTFGSTSDALPYIGKYHKTPHTYYALGFGGNGITFSVIAAEIIRDMIMGKRNVDSNICSFTR